MNEPEWYQHDGRYILLTESRAPMRPAMVTAVAIAILLTLGLWLLLSFGPESFRTRGPGSSACNEMGDVFVDRG